MKKLKVIIISLIALLIIIVGLTLTFIPIIIYPLLIFILFYIGTYYILDFDIEEIGYFSILLFPAFVMSSLSFSLLVYSESLAKLIVKDPLGSTLLAYLMSSIIVIVCGYAVIISMNIFNVSRYKRIPLLQAAQTITYIFSYVCGYLVFSLAHHFYLPWYLLIPFYICIGGYLVFINNWSLKLQVAENITYTLIGVFLVFQITLVFSFIPMIFYLFPLAITVCIYIMNGVILHIHRRSSLNRVVLEYAVLVLIIVFLILFTSKWGVAGNLLGL